MSDTAPDVLAAGATPVSSPRRFALVGAPSLYQEALKCLIETRIASSAVEVVAEAATAAAPSDLIVLDVDVEHVTNRRLAELSALVKAVAPRPVLLISGWMDPAVLQRLLRDGVAGIVLRSSQAETLLDAIESVSSGKVWLQRDLLAETFGDSSHAGRRCSEAVKIAALTDRERDIIHVAAGGCTNRQIAESLHISEATVRHHLTSIFAKLGVTNRGELIIFAFRHRLLDESDRSLLC